MKREDKKRFGEMLRIYLAAQGLTCREAGRLIGISASTVSRLCNGENPDAQTLILLVNWMFI